ncbi:MAG: hypothetical protein ACREDZ_07550 [Kiloniellales bacterium]
MMLAATAALAVDHQEDSAITLSSLQISNTSDGTNSGQQWQGFLPFAAPITLNPGDNVQGTVSFGTQVLVVRDGGGGFFEIGGVGGFEQLIARADDPAAAAQASQQDSSVEFTGVQGAILQNGGSRNGGVFHNGLFMQTTPNMVDAGTEFTAAGIAYRLGLVTGGPFTISGVGFRVLAEELAVTEAVSELTLTAGKDSFLRRGNPDRSEGANPGLRLQASGDNRIVVGFDQAAIDDFGDVTTATLVLTIAENADNWGQSNDRTVDAHPLLVDFAEGNGQNAGVPGAGSTRGSGPGVTWNCAEDAEIANQQTDCDPEWNGGDFGSATADPVLHFNGLSGEASWDVTDDVLAGASAWLIKKTVEGQPGKVSYVSREGTDDAGDPDLAPRLILEK